MGNAKCEVRNAEFETSPISHSQFRISHFLKIPVEKKANLNILSASSCGSSHLMTARKEKPLLPLSGPER